MSAILLVPPASEPLSLAEAKAYLRVEHGDDDAVITALIAAARTHLEAVTRRALLTQTWRFALDRWPRGGRFAPRIAPLLALVAARVIDAHGAVTALDVESFVVDAAADVIAAPDWAVPLPGRPCGGLVLDVSCGYGALPSAVPADLVQALRLLLANWYDHRGAVADAQDGAPLPHGFAELVAPYRVLAL